MCLSEKTDVPAGGHTDTTALPLTAHTHTQGAPRPSLHTNQSENKEISKRERSRREGPSVLQTPTVS